jgi:GNAT superfamily N-acetyltransferase
LLSKVDPGDNLIIRPAELCDARAMMQVNYDAAHALAAKHYTEQILDAWAPLSEERLKRFEGFITANPEDEITLVAQLGHDLVGFGRLIFRTAEISSLYVSPKVAGAGIGSKLMTALERCAYRQGLESVWLTAALNATDFYRRCGFIGEHEIEYELPGQLPMTVLKMGKLLASS